MNTMSITREYKQELLTEWWELKKAMRLAAGQYGATLLMRNRMRLIVATLRGIPT